MDDLTVIMMTANKLPQPWVDYHRKTLSEEIGDTPIITVSYKPLDWGVNLIQTEYSHLNIYKQLLRAAKIAKTKFIATADDDTLYHREHFESRPPEGTFGYNFNRWHILSWKTKVPFYYLKSKPGNGCMVAYRDMVISALEKRLKTGKEDGVNIAQELGRSHYLVVKYDGGNASPFYTYYPIVSIYHQQSISHLNQRRRTVPFPIQCFDLPKWGRAEDVLKIFNQAREGGL